MLDGTWRINSEKLRKHQYSEGYATKAFEVKGVENNVEDMWEQVKWGMVESAGEVPGSVRIRGKVKRFIY